VTVRRLPTKHKIDPSGVRISRAFVPLPSEIVRAVDRLATMDKRPNLHCVNQTACTMIHYTLNMGDIRWCPRSKAVKDAIDIFRPVLAPGEHALPNPLELYRLLVSETEHGFRGTISRGVTQLVTIGVADTVEAANEVWPGLERLYLGGVNGRPLGEAPLRGLRRPSRLPWLACVIVGPLSEIARGGDWLDRATGTADCLRDVERCVAWAWLEERKRVVSDSPPDARP
jgi:hypothetical protein